MAVNRCRSVLINVFKKTNIHLTRSSSTESPLFPGAKTTYTETLTFQSQSPSIPVYRVLDSQSTVLDPSQEPKLSPETLLKMYQDMKTLNTMDKILYESQRQGRISFYMTNYGEEAMHIGSAAALSPEDVIYGQYREAGVLVYRGYSLQEFVDQCYGNRDDSGRGKQMPIHYGSKKLNFVTISSPLGTQMPQAVGAAYALKGSGRLVICYYGDGAASEGDAHAAFNFAATLDCPVILFCRNNGFAISTPTREQYKGDGIAIRGPAFGIKSLRVDGNDVLAVYNGMKKAREYCINEQKPVVVEAMGYRLGHHSTSDDSSAYRGKDEEDLLWATSHDAVNKFKLYLIKKGLWTEEKDVEFLKKARSDVLTAFNKGEKKLKPKFTECFEDVYKIMPDHIRKQMEEMKSHVAKYKEHYPLNQFE